MNRLRYFIDERAPRLALTLRLAKHWLAGSVELAAMREHVRPGATVVDIGARRGLFTAYLARRVGREGYVHAFEPFPPNFATLERLFGGCGNVVLHELALSSAPGEATLTVPIRGGRPADALGSLSAPPSAESACSVQVQCARLDDVLPPEVPVSFVKCDVEGHELAVFEGAAGTLKRWRPTVVAEIEQRHLREAIATRFDFLLSLGYQGYALRRGAPPLPTAAFDPKVHQRPRGRENLNMFLFTPAE